MINYKNKKSPDDYRQSAMNTVQSCSQKRSLKRNPCSILISSDFIVSSHVQENLLLSISLQKSSSDSSKSNPKLHGCGITPSILIGNFKARYPFNKFMLSYHATRVATEPNAGGTSVVSEALSVEYFVRRFRVTNVVTEMEVEYMNDNWKKVDYICDFYGQRVGVSVTRAMSYPDPELFSRERAISLLRKKLVGLIVARSGVSKKHGFVKAILHVWCETTAAAELMQSEFNTVVRENEMDDDVIMILTVAEGLQGQPIFYESKCTDKRLKTCQPLSSPLRHPFWWLKVKNSQSQIKI